LVLLADPEEIKEMFAAPADALHPGEGSRVTRDVLGDHSLVQLDEDEHVEQRRMLSPSFQGEGLRKLENLMVDTAEREVAAWPAGRTVEMYPLLQKMTIEIILSTVFGLSAGQRHDLLRDSLIKALDANSHLLSLLPMTRRQLFGLAPWGRVKAALRRSDALIFGLIAKRRRDDDAGDDVLAALLAASHDDGSPMSDREIRDELMTLLSGGHETSASTLAWTFERLARSPSILDRLLEEIDTDEGDAYMTATLQETLRCRPVIPCLPRLVKREIEIGDWTYPPGVALLPEPYLVHRDESLYPQPYVFRPERFLEKPPGTYTWIPFGGGRRRCIGIHFATMEMKVILRVVLGTSRLHPISERDDAPARRSVMVVPRAGAPVTLVRR
jgi:cytochrome P450